MSTPAPGDALLAALDAVERRLLAVPGTAADVVAAVATGEPAAVRASESVAREFVAAVRDACVELAGVIGDVAAAKHAREISAHPRGPLDEAPSR